MRRVAADKLAKGVITPDDYYKIDEIVRSNSDVATWLTSPDGTLVRGMGRDGTVLVETRFSPKPATGGSGGGGASSEKNRVALSQSQLNLVRGMAKSVTTDEEEQNQIIGAYQYLADLNILDPTDLRSIELMRQATGMLKGAVDQGIRDWSAPFDSFSEVRSSDYAKTVLGMRAGFTDYRAFKSEILDPISNVAKDRASANVNKGRAADTGTKAVGLLMRQYGFSHDEAVSAFRAELTEHPDFLQALSYWGASDVAQKLAARYRR